MSIKKRGSSWQVILELGRDAEGKKIRKTVTCKTQQEAEAIETEYKYKRQTNNIAIPSKMTMEELLTLWLENYVENRCEETTRQEYERIIKNKMVPKLGNILVQKLEPTHIQNYYKYLMKELKLSPNTVYRHHANLRKALDYALKQQIVTRNVADAVELPKRKKFEGSFYTVEELLKLQEVIKNHELEVPINLAIFLGLRREEIAGLKWKYIDLENHTLQIKEVRVRVNKGNMVKEPKTKGSNRTLYIPTSLYELLVKYKEKQEEYNKLFGKEYKNTENYVCVKIDGRPFRPEKISAGFTKILKDNKLPHVRLHDLRHTFATLLNESGANIKEISEALGHSDITTTLKIYTHMMDKTNKSAVNKMENILNKKKDNEENKEK